MHICRMCACHVYMPCHMVHHTCMPYACFTPCPVCILQGQVARSVTGSMRPPTRRRGSMRASYRSQHGCQPTPGGARGGPVTPALTLTPSPTLTLTTLIPTLTLVRGGPVTPGRGDEVARAAERLYQNRRAFSSQPQWYLGGIQHYHYERSHLGFGIAISEMHKVYISEMPLQYPDGISLKRQNKGIIRSRFVLTINRI